MPLKYGDLG